MPRGPKKHLKRLNAPKAWMLDKLGGVFSVKPSSGPHKLNESLPIAIFLRLVFQPLGRTTESNLMVFEPLDLLRSS